MNVKWLSIESVKGHLLLLSAMLIFSAGCQTSGPSSAVDNGSLIFLAQTLGPATQLQRADEQGDVSPILVSQNWRDLHPDVADDGRIVFMSNRRPQSGIDLSQRRERFQVFLWAPGDESPTALTESAGSTMAPQFGPEGQRIAFLLAESNRTRLQYVPEANAEPVSVTSARDILDFSWSPDGTQLAAVLFSPGQSHLALLDLEQGNREVVAITPEAAGAVITSVSWSPTGEALAYIVNSPDDARRLYRYELATGERTLLSDPDADVQEPIDWSDDGDTILYSALVDFEFFYDEKKREKVYRGSMQVFRVDEQGHRQAVTSGPGRHGAPVFSPGEERIAYLYAEQLDARRLSLRTTNLEGTEERVLYDRVAPESTLQWSSTNPKNRR
ncbi:hypothetical protein [Marinimicrobium agarilyticum]|uniref:hypothetical protein n=1 Tax=Marinimicrobium agarilyticum TaxID=306546 RepID=UPI0003FCD8CD|nr:hypothetical protein [Marinimicrobium agarilyticum]